MLESRNNNLRIYELESYYYIEWQLQLNNK